MPPHTSNSVITLARLAVSGLGVALLPELVVQRELAEGSLVPVATDPEFASVEYQAVYVERQGSHGAMIAEAATVSSRYGAG